MFKICLTKIAKSFLLFYVLLNYFWLDITEENVFEIKFVARGQNKKELTLKISVSPQV